MSTAYDDRRRRARKLAGKEGLDALWVSDPANVRYLSGFTGSSGFILLGRSHGFFITDSRYDLQARQEVQGLETVICRKGLGACLKELAHGAGIKRIGFSGAHISYSQTREFKRRLRGTAVLQPLAGSLSVLRVIKDDEELAAIRRAIRNAERSLLAIADNIRTGVTEASLGRALACELLKGGCEDAAFNTIVASGSRSALPHAAPSGRKLRENDLLLVDWGAACAGYHSDETRVIYLGEPGGQLREIHRVVMAARRAALESLKPGRPAAEVDRAARQVIENAGFGEYFGHALGHGIGLEVHEAPYVGSASKDILRAGMVFTIEPGIYLPGKGGVRVEDMVYLAADGPRILTGLPRNGALRRR